MDGAQAYYQLKDRLNFKQYSGYMPASNGTELFFWFVESQRSPKDDPVVLWVNGGPGASSVAYGFWTEHGPFRLAKNGSEVDLYEYSWNKIANVLYLEAPSGVGFSFSEDPAHYNTTDSQTANDNYNFLLNFFEVFAEFKKNELFLTGESYGGHYVPTLSALVLARPNDLNMKGFFIGNPGIENDWYFNSDEYAFLTFLWSNALIPQDAYVAVFNACGWSDFLTNCDKSFDQPSPSCVDAAANAWKYVPKTWDPYNVLTGTCHEQNDAADDFVSSYTPWLATARFRHGANITYNPCINNETPIYMNRKDVIKALHAEKHYNRAWPNPPSVWKYGDETAHITKLFPLFFEAAPQWRLMVVSGTADAAVPVLGTQRWISCLGRKTVVDWHDWMLDGDVAGTRRDYEGLSFLTVKGCGHTIPTYCPKQGYEMLVEFFRK